MSSPQPTSEPVFLKDSLENLQKHSNLPNPQPGKPIRTRECNMMSYVDGEGVKREIWMPKGTMTTACKYFSEENWDELAKFPVWNNQQYTDEDDIEEGDSKTQEETEGENKAKNAA